MKLIRILIFIFCLTIPCSLLFLSPVSAVQKFSIGVIGDCRAEGENNVLEMIKEEVFSLTKGEFNVRFLDEYNGAYDCSEIGIQKNIDRLFSDPEIDMVLASGPISSHLLGQIENFPKPCIAGRILNPKLQGIPLQNNKSGKHNLTYVALDSDLISSIDLFKEITDFKNVAFLYDQTLINSIKAGRKYLEILGKSSKTQLTFIPVGDDVQPVLNALGQAYDAVFLTDLAQLDAAGLSHLISYFNTHQIASFSFHNRAIVENGALAGLDRTSEALRFSRRMALLVQRILLQEDPKDFKVRFSQEEKLVINMQTAQEIGVSPSFSLMARAELINNESFVESVEKSTTSETGEKQPIPSFVSEIPEGADEASSVSDDTTTSLSLIDAVNLAIKNNLILKSKVSEVRAGEMNVKEALSKFFPQLGAGMQGQLIDEEHTYGILGVAERSWAISGQVSQVIYSDTVNTNLKTNRHYQQALALSENQERLDIILETGIAYLNMLKAMSNARIQHDNLKLIRSNLILANNRYKAGLSSPSDVYRLESKAAIEYSTYLEALARVDQTRIHLNQILNIDLEDKTLIRDVSMDDGLFIISDPGTRAKLKIDNPENFRYFRDFVVKKGLEQSPELMALNEQISAQGLIYEYAKRSYWSPDVSLNGNIGNTFSKSGKGSDFDYSLLPDALSPYIQEPEDTRWAVSLNLEIPFYEGGAKSAKRIRALETKSQLEFQKRHIQNLIAENIRSALFEISASYPSIRLTRLSAESAAKNLDLVQDAYSKGAVSIVNFLDAQNAALKANTFAENAVYEFLMDFMISERAAGQYSFLMDQEERKKWLQDFQK